MPGVAGRRILVTGAGGFIGAEMVRQVAASGAGQIILLDIAEQQLFAIFSEMTMRGCGACCVPMLGSVRDHTLVAALFDEYHPELIIHAAALKHVPLMERNPFAAVATNSIGTWVLAQVAAEHGARRMIFISTDKAVAPHSIMGASKRIAELAMLAHPQFVTIRLVNVIGSPFSVGPIFAGQIARGGPVTVTHRAAQRFFLTLEEVVTFLAETMAIEPAGGILVPDPGEPVPIEDLAVRMIAASGSDIPIVFTGERPGDKLEESVISGGERYDGIATLGLRRVMTPLADDLASSFCALETAIAARDLRRLLRIVQDLVPDYEPSQVLRDSASDPATAAPLAALR